MSDVTKVITVEEIQDKILSGEIKLDFNNFEPTDSEGHNMEGTVVYNGEEHYVYLSYMNEDSYELQAAKQIHSDLTEDTLSED